MKRKGIIAAVVGFLVAFAISAGATRHFVQSGDAASPCRVPKTMTQTDYNALTRLTDIYYAEHFNEANGAWAVFASTVTPTKVTAVLVIGRSLTPGVPGEVDVQEGLYKVTLTRSCIGDDWQLVSFISQSNNSQAPQPSSPQSG